MRCFFAHWIRKKYAIEEKICGVGEALYKIIKLTCKLIKAKFLHKGTVADGLGEKRRLLTIY